LGPPIFSLARIQQTFTRARIKPGPPERKHFEPEDFLIAFKLALVDAANDVGIRPSPERNDFLSRLVSVYIEEFYRFPPNGDGGSQAAGKELSAGGA